MKSDSKLSKVKSGYLYCCKTPMSIENKLTKNSIKTPVNNILKKQNQPSRLNSMPASTSK